MGQSVKIRSKKRTDKALFYSFHVLRQMNPPLRELPIGSSGGQESTATPSIDRSPPQVKLKNLNANITIATNVIPKENC